MVARRCDGYATLAAAAGTRPREIPSVVPSGGLWREYVAFVELFRPYPGPRGPERTQRIAGHGRHRTGMDGVQGGFGHVDDDPGYRLQVAGRQTRCAMPSRPWRAV